ncbi:ATP-grasp fold amidoligase family protein [Kytococcus schroeteri]|uniref:ATP-grasp fold amidoligase family protein n=1 Tax=Kytococcus schroeteri TaxID=138300 RepID=UPI00114277DE|nr:ATP-grasp fold amidoligase family protein [Kytococcus schroeteri]
MLRQTLRDLPAIKWRDEKIAEWRETARTEKAARRAAEQRAAELEGSATARARSAETLEARLADAEEARRAAEERARAAEAEVERLREATRRPDPIQLPCGQKQLGTHTTLVRDADGAAPRAELGGDLVKALKRAGHEPSAGTTAGDPRAYGSFATHLLEARRYRKRLSDQGLKNHPRRQIPKKLENFALAASHGVRPPHVHAVWRTPEAIDLAGLPDEFVLKSNGGAGSRGVYPVRRVPGLADTYEVADETRRRLTGAEIIHNLTTDKKLSRPWFAEELLVSDVGGAGLPMDYKFFSFYGEVGFAFTRHAPMHRGAEGWMDAQEFRYVDGEGQDIEMRTGASRRDVPLSPLLPEMLEAAKVLSRAVPLPFVRVDLYGTPQGVVMGEITLMPGSHVTDLLPLQDARLGRMWEEAEMRLQIDLAHNGRPYAILAGDHPVPEVLRRYLPKKA